MGTLYVRVMDRKLRDPGPYVPVCPNDSLLALFLNDAICEIAQFMGNIWIQRVKGHLLRLWRPRGNTLRSSIRIRRGGGTTCIKESGSRFKKMFCQDGFSAAFRIKVFGSLRGERGSYWM